MQSDDVREIDAAPSDGVGEIDLNGICVTDALDVNLRCASVI